MVEVKVHKKYLVVIPKEIREKLDIKVGDRLEMKMKRGKIELLPVRKVSERAIERTYGIIKTKKRVEGESLIRVIESSVEKLGE